MKLISSTLKGMQSSKIKDLPTSKCENPSIKHGESLLSYDQSQFLRIALEGNDFSDSTISANTNTEFNIPHDSTLAKNQHITLSASSTNNSNVASVLHDGISSIETVDASKLISFCESRGTKRLGIFRTLYEKTRESFRLKKKIEDGKNEVSSTLSRCSSHFIKYDTCDESIIEDMLCEINKRKQLLLARKQCFLKKKFQDTAQQIEVERQLLYSDAKLKTLQTFLSKIDYEEKSFKISQSSGYINVTDLIVPVKERNKKDFSEYYVCILYHDQHVYMTDYIKAMDNKFVFNGTNICFNNIDSDFEIKIEFFLLKLKKSIRNYSHESRYNLKNDSTCPTPQLLLSPARSFLRPSKNWPVSRYRADSEKSQFVYQGSLTLNLKNISLFGSYILTDLPSDSSIEGVVDISLSARVRLLQAFSGFLTIGNEIGGCAYWNRKWCRLDGFIFNYWNYPEDEGCKIPCGTIDLRYCNSNEIKPASRQICSRSFTLLIETKQTCKPRDRTSVSCSMTHFVERHLLAADSRADLVKWQDVFNNVICTLRQWNTLIPNSLHEPDEYII